MNNIEQIKTDKFSFYIFRDIFNDIELNSIWKEVMFLCDKGKLEDPDATGSATFEDGYLKKNNTGIWIDDLYKKNNISNYLKIYKKPLQNICDFKENDYTLNLFSYTNKDFTLMSYYEDSDYYHPHYDASCYTYVFWLFKEPKCFLGGDLYLNDIDQKIEINSNMGILFPSWATHSVEKVIMLPGIIPFKGFGRFAFTTFYSFR